MKRVIEPNGISNFAPLEAKDASLAWPVADTHQ